MAMSVNRYPDSQDMLDMNADCLKSNSASLLLFYVRFSGVSGEGQDEGDKTGVSPY
jgi:hypothetical protein